MYPPASRKTVPAATKPRLSRARTHVTQVRALYPPLSLSPSRLKILYDWLININIDVDTSRAFCLVRALLLSRLFIKSKAKMTASFTVLRIRKVQQRRDTRLHLSLSLQMQMLLHLDNQLGAITRAARALPEIKPRNCRNARVACLLEEKLHPHLCQEPAAIISSR